MLVRNPEARTLDRSNDRFFRDANWLIVNRHFCVLNGHVMNALKLPQVSCNVFSCVGVFRSSITISASMYSCNADSPAGSVILNKSSSASLSEDGHMAIPCL